MTHQIEKDFNFHRLPAGQKDKFLKNIFGDSVCSEFLPDVEMNDFDESSWCELDSTIISGHVTVGNEPFVLTSRLAAFPLNIKETTIEASESQNNSLDQGIIDIDQVSDDDNFFDCDEKSPVRPREKNSVDYKNEFFDNSSFISSADSGRESTLYFLKRDVKNYWEKQKELRDVSLNDVSLITHASISQNQTGDQSLTESTNVYSHENSEKAPLMNNFVNSSEMNHLRVPEKDIIDFQNRYVKLLKDKISKPSVDYKEKTQSPLHDHGVTSLAKSLEKLSLQSMYETSLSEKSSNQSSRNLIRNAGRTPKFMTGAATRPGILLTTASGTDEELLNETNLTNTSVDNKYAKRYYFELNKPSNQSVENRFVSNLHTIDESSTSLTDDATNVYEYWGLSSSNLENSNTSCSYEELSNRSYIQNLKKNAGYTPQAFGKEMRFEDSTTSVSDLSSSYTENYQIIFSNSKDRNNKLSQDGVNLQSNFQKEIDFPSMYSLNKIGSSMAGSSNYHVKSDNLKENVMPKYQHLTQKREKEHSPIKLAPILLKKLKDEIKFEDEKMPVYDSTYRTNIINTPLPKSNFESPNIPSIQISVCDSSNDHVESITLEEKVLSNVTPKSEKRVSSMKYTPIVLEKPKNRISLDNRAPFTDKTNDPLLKNYFEHQNIRKKNTEGKFCNLPYNSIRKSNTNFFSEKNMKSNTSSEVSQIMNRKSIGRVKSPIKSVKALKSLFSPKNI